MFTGASKTGGVILFVFTNGFERNKNRVLRKKCENTFCVIFSVNDCEAFNNKRFLNRFVCVGLTKRTAVKTTAGTFSRTLNYCPSRFVFKTSTTNVDPQNVCTAGNYTGTVRLGSKTFFFFFLFLSFCSELLSGFVNIVYTRDVRTTQ